MALRKRPIKSQTRAEGKKKWLDCAGCFESLLVDKDTRRALCGRCVAQGGKLR